jgi:hypothetical protein
MFYASLLPAWLTSDMDWRLIFQSRGGKNIRMLFVAVQALQCAAKSEVVNGKRRYADNGAFYLDNIKSDLGEVCNCA